MANALNAGRRNRVAAAAVLALALGCPAPRPDPPPPAAGPAPVAVEFRRAETAPREGLTPARWPQTGETIYLHPGAELTAADIAEASPGMTDDGRHEVLIRFTPAGAEKMARLFDAHRDKPVAILVDGRVVCAARLVDRIAEWSAISGDFTRAEVDRIVAGLTGR